MEQRIVDPYCSCSSANHLINYTLLFFNKLIIQQSGNETILYGAWNSITLDYCAFGLNHNTTNLDINFWKRTNKNFVNKGCFDLNM